MMTYAATTHVPCTLNTRKMCWRLSPGERVWWLQMSLSPARGSCQRSAEFLSWIWGATSRRGTTGEREGRKETREKRKHPPNSISFIWMATVDARDHLEVTSKNVCHPVKQKGWICCYFSRSFNHYHFHCC